MPRIDELLRMVVERGGSDLHLNSGLAPRLRIRGDLVPIERPPLTDASCREHLYEICTPAQIERFESTGDMDLAYGIPGVARFRCNFYVQINGASAVFRLIPDAIVQLGKLGLPAAVDRFPHMRRGLVLVTGPTGSGKSTTLAAILDVMNRTYRRHIVTVEDPIEFVHVNVKSVLTQREVGAHTASFAAAVRAAVRQDPDVLLVGEMRDLETISLALTAAEMGLLVFGTLHTNDAVRTIDRIIDVFPADQQHQARVMLADSLQGVCSQILLKTRDGKGRAPATEILLGSRALSNCIREGNTAMIPSIIQAGKAEGMRSMDDDLWELATAGRIFAYDAYSKAHDKKRFEGLQSGEGDGRK